MNMEITLSQSEWRSILWVMTTTNREGHLVHLKMCARRYAELKRRLAKPVKDDGSLYSASTVRKWERGIEKCKGTMKALKEMIRFLHVGFDAYHWHRQQERALPEYFKMKIESVTGDLPKNRPEAYAMVVMPGVWDKTVKKPERREAA